MKYPADRDLDLDIINLDGALFERAHVTAPVEPEPERTTPVPSQRGPARIRSRNARRASRVVLTAAAVLLLGGLAAARQANRHASVVAAPAPEPAPVAVAPPRGGGVAVVAQAPPAEPDVSPPPMRAPEATPAEVPRAVARVEPPAPKLVVASPAPALSLDALAARKDLDRPAAAVAIASAARRAGSCLGPDDARSATVQVTFAPSGRATSAALVSGPLVGTAAGACVARALAGAHVHPFDGAPVAVTTTTRF
jgi:hypothetical protein